jgi:hypothetical protein
MKSLYMQTLLTAVTAAFLFQCPTMAAEQVQAQEEQHQQHHQLLEVQGEVVAESNNVATSGCSVIGLDGTDRSAQLVKEQDDGYFKVECNADTKACIKATIRGCDVVHCQGVEACEETLMYDIKVRIQCNGFHSCHRTKMMWTPDSGAKEEGDPLITVNCMGSAACDVAEMNKTPENPTIGLNVYCEGTKACRKARIVANQGDVVCTGGDNRYAACEGSTTITAKCLLCGTVCGCAPHINECSFHARMDEETTTCHATNGDCDGVDGFPGDGGYP